ncbi:hypothetical protein RJ40_10525 [Methanofollis aquaemaris]|uniref:Uncharacterized protein n=1 Tax=Methanofollis aquaemaris TaxID=126734 RepID=A0A8A3S6Y9_9EURY|nr:Hsp20/alpha crystallin family protein [Methanofollis aquaemaris]QSZ67898.1 hypothetical protein RJ40_10525 [Methanofollis aquaemaris]
MSNNPYDEIFKNLAEILKEALSQNGENPRVIGCAIIAGGGGPGPEPEAHDDDGIDYEITECDRCVYITAPIPPDCEEQVSAAIEAKAVTLTIGGVQETIDLESEVDEEQSSVSCNHGVLDIVCVKTE